MRKDEIERTAKYYDTHDMSHVIDHGDVDTTVTPEPMEVISVRLPGAVMDAIRSAAKTRGVRPSNLIREWLEEQLARKGPKAEATVPVSALLAFVAEHGSRHRKVS